MYGQEHKAERTHAMLTLGRLREAHPDLFTLTAIVGACGGNGLQIHIDNQGGHSEDGPNAAGDSQEGGAKAESPYALGGRTI